MVPRRTGSRVLARGEEDRGCRGGGRKGRVAKSVNVQEGRRGDEFGVFYHIKDKRGGETWRTGYCNPPRVYILEKIRFRSDNKVFIVLILWNE